MKNKKLAAMLLSLGLVGVVGTGATLSYFSKDTGPVTNVFTFGEGYTDDNFKLLEHTLGEDGRSLTEETTNSGVTYENVQPGETLNKDPFITLNADNPSYLYISIEKDNNISIVDEDFTTNWVEVATNGNKTMYRYKDVVEKGSNEIDVFNQVKVDGNATLAGNVIIKAAAVQASGDMEQGPADGIAKELLGF